MMIKRLVKLGNSQGLVIEKPLMALLGLTMETDLEVTTDGRSILITPRGVPDQRAKFKEAVADVNSTVSGTRIRKPKPVPPASSGESQ